MKQFLQVFAILAASLALAGAFAGTASAVGTVHYVSAGPLIAGPDTSCDFPLTTSIQVAVTLSNPGDTIVVCDGVYTEQVTISKDLTLAGSGNSIVQAPTALAQDSDAKRNIVTVRGATVR